MGGSAPAPFAACIGDLAIMAVVIRSEDEDIPPAWPLVDGLTGDDLATAWVRVEQWISYRWAARNVVWSLAICADGTNFTPRFRPFTLATAEHWDDASAAWVSTAPKVGPFGYILDSGFWRITGVAGDGSYPPSDVREAVRRLGAYTKEVKAAMPGGLVRESLEIGEMSITRARPADALASAIHRSGAADLLRRYRGLS